MGVSASDPSRAIGDLPYLRDQSDTKLALYKMLAGDQTLMRRSPPSTACAPSSEPMGRRPTRMPRPSRLWLNCWTAHSSHRCFSVPIATPIVVAPDASAVDDPVLVPADPPPKECDPPRPVRKYQAPNSEAPITTTTTSRPSQVKRGLES